jgi:hypothetical protein
VATALEDQQQTAGAGAGASDWEVVPPQAGSAAGSAAAPATTSADFEVVSPEQHFSENPQFEGTYAMTKQPGSGQFTSVPYSKVEQAKSLGYGFSDSSGQTQYQKDYNYAQQHPVNPNEQPGILSRMAENFRFNTQPVSTAGAPVSSAIHNISAAAGRVIGSIPGFAADLTKAFASSVKSGDPKAVLDVLDPLPMFRGLKDQFVQDWQKDPKMALENLLGTAGGMAIAREAPGAFGKAKEYVGQQAEAAGLRPSFPAFKTAIQGVVGAGPKLTKSAVTDAAQEAAKNIAARPQQLRDYATQLADVRANNSAILDAQARQEALGQGVAQSSSDIGQQLQNVEAQTRATASGKFQQIGNVMNQYVDREGNTVDTSGMKPADLDAAVKSGEVSPKYVADQDKLQDVLAEARSKLKGSQENIKQFNDITRQYPGNPEPTSFNYQGATITAENNPSLFKVLQEQNAQTAETPKPLTFDNLHGYYTELNQAISNRIKTTGYDDVTRALVTARDGIKGDDTSKGISGMLEDMTRQADKDGRAAARDVGQDYPQSSSLLNQWRGAKNYYRNFMQTFHEPTGPSGSGSPVAQALNADPRDPLNVLNPFTGNSGDRGVQDLAQYSPELAERVNAVRDLHDQWQSSKQPVAGVQQGLGATSTLPYPRSYTGPEGNSINAYPTNGAAPNPDQISVKGELKPEPKLPAAPGAPEVNLQQLKLDAVNKAAESWGTLSKWDARILAGSTLIAPIMQALGVGHSGVGYYGSALLGTEVLGRLGLAQMLDRPAVIRWLSEPSEADMRVIAKIPGADRVKILTAITDEAGNAIQAAGKPAKIAPSVADFLGPQNAARLGAINLAVAQQASKNKKQGGQPQQPQQPAAQTPAPAQP